MKKPQSILSQLLQFCAVLIGVATVMGLGLAGIAENYQMAAAIAVAGMLSICLCLGIAEILQAVVRAASACEELVRLQKGE